jgi:hypothetical protein
MPGYRLERRPPIVDESACCHQFLDKLTVQRLSVQSGHRSLPVFAGFGFVRVRRLVRWHLLVGI